MGKKGLLLCVCQGTCPSFHKMNIFEVLNTFRREKAVDFVAIHPQLCADDGDAFLKELLKDADVDKLYVAGCDPTMQKKMFKDAFEAVGFDKEKHVGVDIRNMSTEEAVSAIKEALELMK
ncbi:heterodisulfide reductase subunit A-like protein [Thermotoga sp. SG1]|uniref:heterodisulfide reductase subunit A-like protein n=1 Tax=Thermotoga sp. SG1 TaxID=126739 RepID=UPI000C7723FC|nr:heterodisulfide reductase subunit A-like protein [Thermotoga sp. SG1]PLV56202.1 heterodisulfide reductase subunit A-like protein [Thermotoga sp. SG1]